MTTSWALATRGRITDAVATNLGGTLLAFTAMIVAPWLFASAWLGRWWLVMPSEKGLLLLIATIALITALDWAFRVYY